MIAALSLVWNNPYVKAVAMLLAFYVFVIFVRHTGDIWIITASALLIAALVRPALERLEQLRIPKGLGVVLILLAMVFLLGLLATVMVLVVEQVGSFAKTLPATASGLAAWWNQLPDQMHHSNLPDWLVSTLEQAYGSLGQLVLGLADQLVKILGTFAKTGLFPALAGVTGGVVKLAAFLVLFVYLLSDGPHMGRALLGRIPTAYLPRIEQTIGFLERSVMGYFRGQILVAVSMGVVVGLGLWLLKIPLALPVAVLVAVLELVPYLGVALGAVLVIFVSLPLGWLAVIKALAVLILASQLEGHVLAPLIVGHATALHPVTVLIALLLGERLAGIGGMIVAVPLMAFARLWLDEFWPQRPKASSKIEQ